MPVGILGILRIAYDWDLFSLRLLRSTARNLCIYHHTTKLLVSNIITSRVQQTTYVDLHVGTCTCMLAELSEARYALPAEQRELRT